MAESGGNTIILNNVVHIIFFLNLYPKLMGVIERHDCKISALLTTSKITLVARELR
jgi:hypothetical protein